MKTVPLCEELCWRYPGFVSVLELGGVVTPHRMIGSVKHPEFEGILSRFKDPKVCICVSTTIAIFIVEPVQFRRTYPYVRIDGATATVGQTAHTALFQEMLQCFQVQDFLPDPNAQMVIWVDNWKTLDGVVFYQYDKQHWTVQDPRDPDAPRLKITVRKILQNLVNSLKEEKQK